MVTDCSDVRNCLGLQDDKRLIDATAPTVADRVAHMVVERNLEPLV
jgi:hypothetical protein